MPSFREEKDTTPTMMEDENMDLGHTSFGGGTSARGEVNETAGSKEGSHTSFRRHNNGFKPPYGIEQS